MALTTAIFVGESKDWIPDLVAKAKELKVNEGTVHCPLTKILYHRPKYSYDSFFIFFFSGHQPGADLGPVISPAAKERICNLVQSGAEQGAKVGMAFAESLIFSSCILGIHPQT